MNELSARSIVQRKVMPVGAPSSDAPDRQSLWTIVLSCGVGQVFEIYDFLIYAFMAAPLSQAFFPSHDAMTSLLATFATFAVGFVMRPVGALVIGAYGDRHGRRAALVLTIGMMAVGTGMIGVIPSYARWGMVSPALLVLCRMAQGFSAGGEWGGAAAFLVESAPTDRRGFIGSFQQSATAFGLLLATLVSFLMTKLLAPADFPAWGWRLPFLFGLVLAPIGHLLRRHVPETQAFKQIVVRHEVARAPILVAIRDFPVALLAAFGLTIVGAVVNYVFLVFLPSFAQQQLGIPASTTFLSTTLAGVVYFVLCPVTGALSDRIGRKPVLFAMAALSALLAYPLFLLLVSVPTAGGLMLVQAIASVLLAMFCGPICATLAEMFPTRIRYTALSVSYGTAVAIFGGLAPYASTLLIRMTGNRLAPAFYVIIAALVSFVAIAFVAERAGKPLPDEQRPDEHIPDDQNIKVDFERNIH